MSEITGDSSTSDKKIVKADRKRNDSGEIDVFEATRYFSDFNESALDSKIIQKQSSNVTTEYRQNRVHPHTEDQPHKPRGVVVVKSSSSPPAIVTRGGGKLTSFLNSLLRSAGFKKAKSSPESKLKPSPKIEILGEKINTVKKKRRQSFVATQTNIETISPIIVPRRRSFDEKHLNRNDEQEKNLKISSCESLFSDKKVQSKDQNKIDDGFESDSSAESDLFELDLFTKSNL